MPNQLKYYNLQWVKIHPKSLCHLYEVLEQSMANKHIISNRKVLKDSYKVLTNEISLLDDKLFSMVMKIKKENSLNDLISRRIEE